MNEMARIALNDSDLLRRADIFQFLEEICQDLEPTATQDTRLRDEYGAAAKWLSESTDPLLASINVYLHGSTALGTSVRPIGGNEIDGDVICLALGVDLMTPPETLKKAIGDRFRESPKYASILEPKKRCWRLNLPGDIHLDFSPTIQNPTCMNQGELVPDRDLRDWHPTNPIGYRLLFERRAALTPRFRITATAMQQRDEATTEPYPTRKSIKGVLVRLIQLLKRHRDHHFLDIEEEVAPISVVITTLAMRSYEYCVTRHVFDDELEVLVETIRMMPHFIERPMLDGKKQYAVWNETTNGENFAERWNSQPARVDAFYAWHTKVLSDFEQVRDAVGLDKITTGMQNQFGAPVVERVLTARSQEVDAARKAAALLVSPSLGLITGEPASATTTVPVPSHEFYGD